MSHYKKIKLTQKEREDYYRMFSNFKNKAEVQKDYGIGDTISFHYKLHNANVSGKGTVIGIQYTQGGAKLQVYCKDKMITQVPVCNYIDIKLVDKAKKESRRAKKYYLTRKP